MTTGEREGSPDQYQRYATVRDSGYSPIYVLAKIARDEREMGVTISQRDKDIAGEVLPDYLSRHVVIYVSGDTRAVFDKVRRAENFQVLEEAASDRPADDFEGQVEKCDWSQQMKTGIIRKALVNRRSYYTKELKRIGDAELGDKYWGELATITTRMRELGSHRLSTIQFRDLVRMELTGALMQLGLEPFYPRRPPKNLPIR